MADIDGIHIKIQLFRMHVRQKYIAQTIQNIRQGTWLFIQMHFPAFNTAHIQNVIDQAQQMVSRCHNLFQIFRYLFLVVHMRDCKSGKSDNRVHRRADVMGHIGQKDAFCLVCLVRLLQRVFQQIFLFDFVSDLFFYTAES